MAYLWLKILHVLSATLLFGTGLGSAYYMWRAHLTGDARVVAVTARHVVAADWLLTTPTVILQPVTGLWMLHLAGIPWTQRWVLWSLALYLVAGACWLPVVWLQVRARDLAAEAVSRGAALPPRYHRYMRIWFALGWPAFLAALKESKDQR
jgi:uncharacterized membrane protein